MRRVLAAVCLGVVLSAPSSAFGQAVARPPVRVELSAGSDGLAPGESLLDRFGVSVGRSMIESLDPNERWRGVERLSEVGSAEAIDALLASMDSGSPLARDLPLRLYAVRVLARHADREEVRTYLVRELMDAAGRRDAGATLHLLLRETAALALARWGGKEAEATLATTASLRGPAGDAARSALVTVPPATLDALLFETTVVDEPEPGEPDEEEAEPDERTPIPAPKKGSTKPGSEKKPKEERTPRLLTAQAITLLGELGDLRAIGPLRGELDRTDRSARAAAALALARLGDGSVADVARVWAVEPDPRLAASAAEVLVALGHPDAAGVTKKILAIDAARGAGVRLAYDLASPALADALGAALSGLDRPDGVRAVMALGRAGEVKRLVELLADPELGPAAMTALSQSTAEGAVEALERGIAGKAGPTRRAFVRVALLRALTTGQQVSGLEGALEASFEGADPEGAELGALGLVALGVQSAGDVLASAQARGKARPAVIAGAARGALARGGTELAPFGEILEHVDPERPSLEAIAAGVALLSPEAADRVPQAKLLRLAENGGPLASVAARHLPRRDDGSARRRVVDLLGGTDPSVRVAVALGLSESADASTVSLLARAYLREEDVRVRRALVWSLAVRGEPQRKRTLSLARDLDPDREVRALAHAALEGQPIPGLRDAAPARHAAAMTQIDPGPGKDAMLAFRVVLPSGVALPVVSAPDGALLVPGVPFGRASVELAPGSVAEDAPAR